VALGVDEARNDVKAFGIMRGTRWRQQRVITDRDDSLAVDGDSSASRARRRDDGSTSDY
jgi:hypothetical protein